MTSYIVLSHGRSGSVLTAHNIGRALGALPVYYQDSQLQLTGLVVNSHTLLNTERTKDYTRVFSLREDPVDTILSSIIAYHTTQYHKLAGQQLPTITPFCDDLQYLPTLCKEYIAWHEFYAPSLTAKDAVVVYEQLIPQLSDPKYDRIHPNKENILLNYAEMCDYIKTHYLQRMLASISPFLNHTGIDVYPLIIAGQ
jgi:hypothetical protein